MSKSKSQSELSLRSRASDLLNYCFKNQNFDLSYDSPVVIGFIKTASSDHRLDEKWSFEVAFDCLFGLLDEFSDEINSVDTLTPDSYVDKFVDRFIQIMEMEVADHWLVIPLHRASLGNVIQFDNYLFLPDEMHRNEKIDYLARLSSISHKEMAWRAEHTEKTRSPSFYDYALLCHKISHHTPWVFQMAQNILVFDIALLRILENALRIDSSRTFRFKSLLEIRRRKNRHILVNGQGPGRWTHRPIWGDNVSTDLPGELDWLQNTDYQSKFVELVTLLGYGIEIDRLAFRFRKAVNLFNKAKDLQLNTRQSREGFALEILHLMIAAESLLLDRETEKRLRLAVLLSRLVHIEGSTTEDIYSTIDNIYNWRSDYVHSGNDVFPEYDENYQEGDIQQKVYLARHAISRLISDAPKWLHISESRIKDMKSSSSDRVRENAWFGFLNETWLNVLAGVGQSSP